MVEQETSGELSDTILRLCADIKNLGVDRVDSAPGLLSAMSAERLKKYGTFIETGRAENKRAKLVEPNELYKSWVQKSSRFHLRGALFKIDPGFGHSHTQFPHISRWVVLKKCGHSNIKSWTNNSPWTSEFLSSVNSKRVWSCIKLTLQSPLAIPTTGPCSQRWGLVYLKQD